MQLQSCLYQMKRCTSCLLLLLFFSSKIFAQLSFQKSYTFAGDAAGLSGLVTKDNGYLIVGWNTNGGSGDADAYLVKTDSLGNIQWTRSFGTAVDDYAFSVYPTFDGGYILGCDTYTAAGDDDILLIKIDSAGNLSWTKKYDNGFGGDHISNVIQTVDSGFILIGSTDNVSPCCKSDMYVVRTDMNGNVLWRKSYHGTNNYEYGMSVQQTADGNFVLLGTKYDGPILGPFYIWMLKIDDAGIPLWEGTYGEGTGYFVNKTSDNGFIITGSISESIALVKTDSSGGVEWEKLFKVDLPNVAYGNAVEQTGDGSYIITGETGTLGTYDTFLIRTDANGDILWTKCYGGAADDVSYSVKETADKGFAVFAYTDNFPSGNRSMYLIKTDSSGNSYCNQKNILFRDTSVSFYAPTVSGLGNVAATPATPTLQVDSGGVTRNLCFSVGQKEISARRSNLNLFPNPSGGKFTVHLPEEMKKGKVIVYDIYGEIIFEDQLLSLTEATINLNNPSPGIYFVEVLDGNNSYFQKVVIQNLSGRD